jgi:hypothetical protein
MDLGDVVVITVNDSQTALRYTVIAISVRARDENLIIDCYTLHAKTETAKDLTNNIFPA